MASQNVYFTIFDAINKKNKHTKHHRLFPRSRQALSKGTLVNPSIEPGTFWTSRGCKTREFANKKTMNQPWKEQLGEYTEYRSIP